jgi:hypothetical protein
MPALIPTDFTGTILWLGHVVDRSANLAAEPVGAMMARFEGPEGEDHAGLTRASCSRVKAQYPVGTQIRNTRQFSVLSGEELDAIAQDMGIDKLDPAWLGATMVIGGIPDFSHVPPSSRLQGDSGATLVVDMQNRPCLFPAKVIEAHLPGSGARFKPAASGRRGITAWVEREGAFHVGDKIRLHIPDQPAWQG